MSHLESMSKGRSDGQLKMLGRGCRSVGLVVLSEGQEEG